MNNVLIKEWLIASKVDLDSAKCLFSVEHLISAIAFHSQQAIEKSLKAIISSKNMDTSKIHSLNKLFALSEMSFQIEDKELVNKLDKLYIDARYPGNMGLQLLRAGRSVGANVNSMRSACRKIKYA